MQTWTKLHGTQATLVLQQEKSDKRKPIYGGLHDCHGNVSEWTSTEDGDKQVVRADLG